MVRVINVGDIVGGAWHGAETAVDGDRYYGQAELGCEHECSTLEGQHASVE